MCIIVVKPEKVTISADSFRTMWKVNSDGAGFMYATGDRVVVSKGFMKFNEFWDAYQEAGPLRKMVVLPGTHPRTTVDFPVMVVTVPP